MKVYEAVTVGLVAEGCKTLFGLMGDGNMSLWGALGRQKKIDIVSSFNEAGAVSMADGYSRTTGQVGLCTITCGPGLTQVGTSLSIAVRNRSQMVLITGQIAAGAKNNIQSMDQRRFVEACGARFHDISSADNLADEMAEAFYAARVHRIPVVLNLDMALQEQSFDWDFDYRPSTNFLPAPIGAPSDESLQPLLEKLIAAERPVIIAGLGAQRGNAKPEILKLAAQLGALVGTSLQAKDLFLGEEYNLGISGTFASAPAEHLFAESDFVLALGAELGYYTAEGGLMFPSAEVARIDIKAAPDEIGVIPGLYVCGDAKKTAATLSRLLEARKVQKEGFRTAATREILNAPAAVFTKPTDGLDPRVLAQNLSQGLPKDVVLTIGAAHYFSFPAMYTALPEGALVHFSHHFGAVGQALPLSIGVSVGHPGRAHVAMEGDGSVMMNLQELYTVTRHKIQLVLIIWNDAGYGAEVHKLKAKGFDPSLAQWQSADFAAIGKAFGGDGVRLASEADLAPTIERGIKAGGLFIIDARVSPSEMSDPYGKLHFGRENRAPHLRRLNKGA